MNKIFLFNHSLSDYCAIY